MNIEAHIISFNEEKMIRHTLNHYTSFCSKIFLHDNRSIDNTRSLADAYPNVKVVDFESANIDERNYLKIKNNAWKGSKADYVIMCDTDEFLFSPTLLEDLEKLKRKGVTIPLVNGYNMYCDTFPYDYSTPIFDQVKRGARAYNFDKQIIFNPQKIREINYLPGCHHHQAKGTLLRDSSFPLKLLHYKYLGTKYVSDKHEMYVKRLSSFNLKRGYGKEYITQDLEASMNTLNAAAKNVI